MGIVRKYLSFGGGLNFLGIVNGGNFDCHLGNEGGRGGGGKGIFISHPPPHPPVQTLVN
jgi:hypothetical protein